ncbi:MAG TPA: CHAD domain-containing protein [Caulobacteraceae bacterium]|jgi:inorganic triphosphatase YgiF
MAAAPQEIELKFALPAERLGEVAAAIPELAAAAPRALVSTYYDTAKGALRRAGFALRVRRHGKTFVQTLKDDGDGAFTRGEWEQALTGPTPDLKAVRATPAGKALPKRARLRPRFVVEVTRRSADIEEGDSRIELSLDEGLAKSGGREAHFAELELELKSGPQWGLFTLARRLAGQADVTLSFVTKAERGDWLARPPRSFAQKFVTPALSRDLDCRAAFRIVALACLRQVAANAERLRHRASPEVIHQMRVGLRRLRSLLTTFRKVVADARLPAIKAELKWLTGELDAARNLDVLLQGDYRAAVAQKDDASGLKGLGARLRGSRRLAYARAASAAESDRFRRLMVDLLVWIEAGPWTLAESAAKSRHQPVEALAVKELDRRRRKILRRGHDLAALDPEHRHKLRIEAKKLRYSADVFVGLFDRPKRATAFLAALKEVQDALGALNDIVVGEKLAHEAAASAGLADAETAFVAGRISGTQKARVEPLLEAAETALAELGDVKPFWR